MICNIPSLKLFDYLLACIELPGVITIFFGKILGIIVWECEIFI